MCRLSRHRDHYPSPRLSLELLLPFHEIMIGNNQTREQAAARKNRSKRDTISARKCSITFVYLWPWLPLPPRVASFPLCDHRVGSIAQSNTTTPNDDQMPPRCLGGRRDARDRVKLLFCDSNILLPSQKSSWRKKEVFITKSCR